MFCMVCAYCASWMRKPALSQPYAASFPPLRNNCLSAVYAWTRCPRIHSPALIPVDMPFAANASADTSWRASKNIDFLYSVPLALRTQVRERRKLAVRVACGWSSQRLLTRPRNSEVSQSLVLNLGLTDEQFRIWTEMELASFSILLHCRKYVCCSHPTTSCVNGGTGASGRCSWPETNTKRQTSSFVRFRTANTHGANSVNSRSTLVGRITHAMVRQN